MSFKFYGVTVFSPNITITISSAVSLPYQNTNHTKIKTRISRLGEFNFFFVYFPISSSKDDISFRLELGSAHVKFDRLNQQSNLIVWVDLNRY